MLHVGVLGDLTVASGGRTVELHQPKLRTLVCSLVVDADQFVPVDVIEERLWPTDRPTSSRKLVQTYVSRLRTMLGSTAHVVDTSGSRYRLRATQIDLDVRRFEALTRLADTYLTDARYVEAVETYDRALAAWRGRALADVAELPWANPEATRLEEMRLTALERRVEARLCQWDHVDVLPELIEMTLAHPLRENLCAHLMIALYRSGRQAEALQAFRGLREQLVEQLGVEPTDRLCELEVRILRHDPGLLEPCPGARQPTTVG